MIHSVYFIDVEDGIPLIEYQNDFPTEDGSTEYTTILGEYFNTLEPILEHIRYNRNSGQPVDNFTRMVPIESYNIIFHFFAEGNFIASCINDADDDKGIIMKKMGILARRFWQKHSPDIHQFRYFNQTNIFQSFIIDIKNQTMYGKTAQILPRLIVNGETLNRLIKMSMINQMEAKVAQLCRGDISAISIARQMQIEENQLEKMLQKMSELDILKF